MANRAQANGLSPVSFLSGAPWNGQARKYAIPTSDTTASYAIGDIVQTATGSDANGVVYVKKLNATGYNDGRTPYTPLGVIVGISPVDAGVSLVASNLDLTQTFILAGTRTAVRYVYVADDPNIIFEAGFGTTATNATLAKANYNAGIGSWYSTADQTYAIDQNTSVTALSQSKPYSNIIIASATVATTATLPLRLLGLVQREGNEVGAYSRVLVRFNLHEFGTAVSNYLAL